MKTFQLWSLVLVGTVLSVSASICCAAKPAYFYAVVRLSVWRLLAWAGGPVFADSNQWAARILTGVLHALIFLALTYAMNYAARRLGLKSKVAPVTAAAIVYVIALFFAFRISAP